MMKQFILSFIFCFISIQIVSAADIVVLGLWICISEHFSISYTKFSMLPRIDKIVVNQLKKSTNINENNGISTID